MGRSRRKASGSLARRPQGHREMLFAEHLTEEMEAIVLRYQEEVWNSLALPQDCGEASLLWGEILQCHLSDSEIYYIAGDYIGSLQAEVQDAVRGGSSPPGRCEHVWLEINGSIFDPTAAQYGAPTSGEWSGEDYLTDRRTPIDVALQRAAEEDE